jgi:hypothetical protein
MSVVRTIVRVGARIGLPCVLALASLSTSGCVVEERAYARPARPCRDGFWVEGHHDRWGNWHRGHWRCPGVVEVVEVR